MIGEALREHDGEITHVEGAFHDITEHEHEHDARLAVEERLTSTLNSLTDGLVIFDTDWRYTYVNPAAEGLLHRRASELIGRIVWEAFADSGESIFGSAMLQAAESLTTSVVRGYHGDLGVWLEITAYPSAAGQAVYMRDVGGEELVRQELAAKSEVIRSQATLLDVARDAIVVRGIDDWIQYWNRSAELMYGWSAEEVIGLSARELLYPVTDAFDAATAIVLREGQWSGDIEQRTRDGARLIAECSWTLVRDDAGRPASILAVNTDVTGRRRQDELALRRERMESLGTLAGGVAHDLNNVLAPILMSVQLLSTTERDPNRRRMLATMEASVKRGADMIRQVLSFASGAEGRRITVDMDRLMNDLKSFCEEVLPDNIVLNLTTEESLWSTVGDPTQLSQVLINLVTNARAAMQGGGRLMVTAQNIVLRDAYTSITHMAKPGRYVAIEVEDDGDGMSDGVVGKVFEPFFTTKPPGSGTGLGLASSMAIVRAHGGHMQVYSEPGHGSRFQIYLPANAEGADLPIPLQDPRSVTDYPRGDGQLILVVDDEEAIREMTREALDAFGYVTIEASNGREALDLVESNLERIDLVLTDMMMPVMDGAAFAAAMLAAHPEVPIIAASGLNANGGVARAENSGVHYFLAKPFTTELLVVTIAAALKGTALETP